MARQNDGGIRQLSQGVEAVVHVCNIRAWKVGASASFQEKCVTADEATIGKETLTTWSVARSVNAGDIKLPNLHNVSGAMAT